MHSVFINLLINKPHPNPLIYFKEVRHYVLEMVVKFIYHGQCHKANEEIQDFLNTGIDLMINGLMETIDPPKLELQNNIARNINPTASETIHQTKDSQLQKTKKTSSHIPVQMSAGKQQKVPHIQDNGKFDCKSCDKKFNSRGERSHHKMSLHEGIIYRCDQCDYIATTQVDLRKHQQSQHIYKTQLPKKSHIQ